jgi:hypothetical protein
MCSLGAMGCGRNPRFAFKKEHDGKEEVAKYSQYRWKQQSFILPAHFDGCHDHLKAPTE